jgi:hypothetical protein
MVRLTRRFKNKTEKTRRNLEGAQDVRRSTPRHGCRVGEHAVRAEKGVSLVTFFAPAKKVTRSRSE